jgi:nitric oxide reductase activation protein
MDQRALSRMAAGSTAVYTRRVHTAGVDTAVGILVDGSGSMTSRIGMTALMTLHLIEAVEVARGTVAAWLFHGEKDYVELCAIKSFGEKFDARRLLSMKATRYTPLSVAILAASQELRAVRADRRILLVLTDGGCDLGNDCVMGAVAMAENRGVECAGIGIGVDVDFVFDIHARVDEPTDLIKAGLGIVARALEHQRKKAA